MNRGRTISVLTATTLLAVGGLSACSSDNGDGKQLSRASASELSSTLDRVERDVNDGNCDAASTQAQALVDRAGSLPDSVDSGLRQALVDSADRLQVLVTQRCSTSPTGPSAPTGTGTTAATGESGPTGGEENHGKPGKGKAKGLKKQKGRNKGASGPTGQDQTGIGGGNGGDNKDSGGAAP